jgi:hypothetical protein
MRRHGERLGYHREPTGMMERSGTRMTVDEALPIREVGVSRQGFDVQAHGSSHGAR